MKRLTKLAQLSLDLLRKRREDSNSTNQKEEWTNNFTELRRLIKEYYEKRGKEYYEYFYNKNLDNLDEIKFIKTHKNES